MHPSWKCSWTVTALPTENRQVKAHEFQGQSVTHTKGTLACGSFKRNPTQEDTLQQPKDESSQWVMEAETTGDPYDQKTERHHSHHGSCSLRTQTRCLQGTHKGTCNANHSFRCLLGLHAVAVLKEELNQPTFSSSFPLY